MDTDETQISLYHENVFFRPSSSHCSGVRRFIQSNGCAVGCGRDAADKVSRNSCSCDGLTISRGMDIKSVVPLWATRSSHCEFFFQGIELPDVCPTQSGSMAKNVPCCGARYAKPFTPIFRVRAQLFP